MKILCTLQSLKDLVDMCYNDNLREDKLSILEIQLRSEDFMKVMCDKMNMNFSDYEEIVICIDYINNKKEVHFFEVWEFYNSSSIFEQ